MGTAAKEIVVPEGAKTRSATQLAPPEPLQREKYPFRTHAWICNITEISWPPIDFDYGRFAIAGCEPGEAYRMTEITDRISVSDIGDKKRRQEAVGALDIAHDMCRQMNGNIGAGDDSQGGFVGVFVCERPEPTKKELEEAHRRLRKYLRHYLRIADQEFARRKDGAWIPDFARLAARYLGLQRDFDVDTTEYNKCPFCTRDIPAAAAICPNCHHVVNAKKYAELTAQEGSAGRQATRGPGSTGKKEAAAESHQ